MNKDTNLAVSNCHADKKTCGKCNILKPLIKFKRRGLYQKNISDICKQCDDGGNK